MIELKRTRYIFFLLFFCISTYSAYSQVQPDSRLAFEYFNDGEWEKAAPMFLEMYSSSNAKPYLNYYVRCLLELKQYDEAEKELRKAQKQTHDVSLYVDLAYILEMQKDTKKAEQYLEKPFQEFPRNVNDIRNLGNSYITYQKLDHAYRVYEIGRSLLAQPNEFRLEMAMLYRMQRRHPEMMDEYLNLLLAQPNFLNSVENYLMSSLTGDIDNNLLDIARDKTVEYIQHFPGYNIFTELLIWIYSQQKEFDLAVDQAISLDIRNRNTGFRTLSLARNARLEGDFNSALRAYNYLIENGPPTIIVSDNRNMNAQLPYYDALVESNQTKLEQYEDQSQINTKNDLSVIIRSYQDALPLMTDPIKKASLFRDLAYIHVYYKDQQSQGLALIDSALSLSNTSPQLHTEFMLDKADFLMVSGDPWASTLLYARIDKENKENPAGSQAKFRKAQLAFFTGDFKWALSQLEVIQGSTSKLIANDAFELAQLIKENKTAEDSLNNGLKALSKAYYLNFQKQEKTCLQYMDSIIGDKNMDLIHDDILFMKAEMFRKQNNAEKAIPLYKSVYEQYEDGIWGHKALFRLAELHYASSDFDQSMILFEKLVHDFPNSFYNLDARTYIRKIKQEQDLTGPKI